MRGGWRSEGLRRGGGLTAVDDVVGEFVLLKLAVEAQAAGRVRVRTVCSVSKRAGLLEGKGGVE
jgi:hypothetical protein